MTHPVNTQTIRRGEALVLVAVAVALGLLTLFMLDWMIGVCVTLLVTVVGWLVVEIKRAPEYNPQHETREFRRHADQAMRTVR